MKINLFQSFIRTIVISTDTFTNFVGSNVLDEKTRRYEKQILRIRSHKSDFRITKTILNFSKKFRRKENFVEKD